MIIKKGKINHLDYWHLIIKGLAELIVVAYYVVIVVEFDNKMVPLP
jgi:hypothetical protein